jgi:hypothetical protein
LEAHKEAAFGDQRWILNFADQRMSPLMLDQQQAGEAWWGSEIQQKKLKTSCATVPGS